MLKSWHGCWHYILFSGVILHHYRTLECLVALRPQTRCTAEPIRRGLSPMTSLAAVCRWTRGIRQNSWLPPGETPSCFTKEGVIQEQVMYHSPASSTSEPVLPSEPHLVIQVSTRQPLPIFPELSWSQRIRYLYLDFSSDASAVVPRCFEFALGPCGLLASLLSRNVERLAPPLGVLRLQHRPPTECQPLYGESTVPSGPRWVVPNVIQAMIVAHRLAQALAMSLGMCHHSEWRARNSGCFDFSPVVETNMMVWRLPPSLLLTSDAIVQRDMLLRSRRTLGCTWGQGAEPLLLPKPRDPSSGSCSSMLVRA